MHLPIIAYIIAGLFVWFLTARYIICILSFFLPPVIMWPIVFIYRIFNSKATYSMKINLPK